MQNVENKKTEIVCITIWSFYGHYREYKLAIQVFKYYTKTIKGDTMTGSFVLCLSIYICSTWIVGFIFKTWYKMKSMTGLHIFVQIKSFITLDMLEWLLLQKYTMCIYHIFLHVISVFLEYWKFFFDSITLILISSPEFDRMRHRVFCIILSTRDKCTQRIILHNFFSILNNV